MHDRAIGKPEKYPATTAVDVKTDAIDKARNAPTEMLLERRKTNEQSLTYDRDGNVVGKPRAADLPTVTFYNSDGQVIDKP